MENDKIKELADKIKKLEKLLNDEVEENKKKFSYQIDKKRVCFQKDIKELQKMKAESVFRYVAKAPLPFLLSAPFIYGMIVPALFMDICVQIYQAVCFPIYKIPKVKRDEYIIIDRNYLSYLNIFEKLNCIYCGYFNGLIAYVQEIAGRTEQFWCPIRHAKKIKAMHSRYHLFLEYGEYEHYKEELAKIRKMFDDLKEELNTL